MRKIVVIVVAAALVWSAYWFVGAAALDRALTAGLSELRGAGWRIETASRDTRGFPNRFDTTFDALEVASPGGTRISMPFFQILALSYKPNEIIAVFPPELIVENAMGDARVTSDTARGSMSFQTAPSLPLDHSSFVIDALAVESAGRSFAIDQLRFATRIPPGAPDAAHQNFGLGVTNLSLPDTVRERLGAAGLGPIDDLRLDATLRFARAIDRHALEDPPALREIDIHDLSLDWGEIALDGAGLLEVGPDGALSGTLDLSLASWQRAIELAVAAGLVPDDQSRMITQGLSLLGGGAASSLDLPLRFADGQILLGPIPLGPAPRIELGR